MNTVKSRAAILLLSIAAGLASTAQAHSFKLGDIEIGHPYSRPTVPGQPAAVAYLALENKGDAGDRLVSVSSPISKSGEIHTMAMDNNIMRMREVGTLELKPAEKIAMTPGAGYHLMLIGVKQPLKAGDKFPLTLTFEKAGKIDVTVNVENGDTKGVAEHVHK
jgi:copper(I)-binding protein